MRILVFIFMLLNMPIALAETLKVEIEERKFGKSEILVEIVLPSINLYNKTPLIITQHGSTLDAEIEGSKVRTDEHSKRLLKKATNAPYDGRFLNIIKVIIFTIGNITFQGFDINTNIN